jgi:hypothetical protein
LAGGLLCNLAVGAVNARHHGSTMHSDAPKSPAIAEPPGALATVNTGSVLVVAAWLAVWIPIGWGVWVTLQKAVLLFN